MGSNFIRVATERYGYEVFAALNQSKLEPRANLSMAKVNLLDASEVLNAVKAQKPDAIVHMAFFNDLNKAYKERNPAWALMVSATENLCNAAKALDIPIVFVSTDWVFDGTQGPATEQTPPNPINLYGALKLVGETVIRQYEKGIVARIAGVFGINWASGGRALTQNAGFGNIPNLTAEKLAAGEEVAIWMQERDLNLYGTPTLASDCSDMMIHLASQNLNGVFHCVGANHVSRTEYAHVTAEVFSLNPELIQTCPVNKNDPESLHGIPIPIDSRLDGNYTANVLGRPLLALRDGLTQFKKQLETGAL